MLLLAFDNPAFAGAVDRTVCRVFTSLMQQCVHLLWDQLKLFSLLVLGHSADPVCYKYDKDGAACTAG